MMIDRDYNEDEYIYTSPIDVPTVRYGPRRIQIFMRWR